MNQCRLVKVLLQMEPHRHNRNIEIHIDVIKPICYVKPLCSMILCGKETEYFCLTKRH
jgi:hypothetical protein